MKKLVFIFLVFAFAKAYSQEVVLYWDVSYSMENRNLKAEFDYLDTFFKDKKEVRLLLQTFSNEIVQEERFVIANGDWTALKNTISSTVYDGATSYEVLDFTKQVDAYILVTDGTSIGAALPKTATAPVTILNSLTTTNVFSLQLLAINSKGHYEALQRQERASRSKQFLLRGTIYEKLGDSLMPLSNVRLSVIDGIAKSSSDTSGFYQLPVQKGAVVQFEKEDYKTVRARVADSRYQDILLDYGGDVLEEVVLIGDLAPEEELISLGGYKLQKKRLGYAVQTITKEEISDIDKIDIKQAVSGQFSNFTLANNTVVDQVDLSQFLGRHKNMSILLDQSGLVVVDGVPQQKATSLGNTPSKGLNFTLNPDIIKSITYLKGLAATNRFGTLGKNGVLLIETILTGNNAPDTREEVIVGTTSTYDGEAVALDELSNASYIQNLKIATDVNEAFTIYLEQRAIYGNSPTFFLDVATYFRGWNNLGIVSRILSNTLELDTLSTADLRALAFQYDAISDSQMALKVYQYILKKAPEQAQSYRDVALALTTAARYAEANILYNKIIQGNIKARVNFSGILKTIEKEYSHFLSKYSTKLPPKSFSKSLALNNGNIDRRIVIEWNDPLAEFDIQIINPQNRYFTWEHTQNGAYQRLIDERDQGYMLEEFFLTSGDIGTWRFNVINYGFVKEDVGQPLYLKFTIYKNYNSPQQTKEVKVVRLAEIEKEFQVLDITI